MLVVLAQMLRLAYAAIDICTILSGDNSDVVPPDSIPNSEVKRLSADDSVGVPM